MNELLKWISITDRFTKMYLNKRFEIWGINSSQHMYILRICEHEGITQDKLQPLLHINKSNITRALVQLESAGFITKEPNKKDKRTIRLYPTEKARSIYQEIINMEDEWMTVLVQGLSAQEAGLLVKLIQTAGGNAIDYLRGEEE